MVEQVLALVALGAVLLVVRAVWPFRKSRGAASLWPWTGTNRGELPLHTHITEDEIRRESEQRERDPAP